MALRPHSPPRVAVFAIILAAHAVFWETLRAVRGDYWSGWNRIELVGTAAGALAYVVLFAFLQFAFTAIPRRRDSRVASLLAAWAAAAIVWGFLFAAWEGFRLSIAVPIAGSLALVTIPAALRLTTAIAVSLGLVPLVAGGVTAVATAYASLLSPWLRQMLVYHGFQHFLIAWAALAITWYATRARRHRMPMRAAACVCVVALAFVPLVPAARQAVPAAEAKPNLLLITVDSLRADYCGVYGGDVDTPALERLAEHGVVFERAYALGPWTLPSMTGLFASMYPPSLTPGAGRARWVQEMQYYHVPPDVPMLAELLRDEGYASYALIANKLLDQPEGVLRGFERHAVFHSSMPARTGPLAQLPFLHEFVGRLLPSVAPMRAADTTRPLRGLAAAFMRQHAGEPFVLWVHFMDPHAPWDPPARFRQSEGPWPLVDPADPQWGGPQFVPETHRLELPPEEQAYVRGLYQGEIRYVDEAIGALLDTLHATGDAANTVVCITADHGEEFWDHGQVTHGQSLYEELIRVPLILAAPGMPAARIQEPFSHLDLMPTLAEVLAVEAPGSWRGTSRAGEFRAPAPALPAQDIFAQGTYIAAPEPQRAIVRGEYKVIEGLESHEAELISIRDESSAIANRKDLKQSAIAAMRQWWVTFPATIEETRTDQPGIPATTEERLRSLGYLD